MAVITIIVPVYNVEPYLHRCVDSILLQTFTDFELILVDDGSSDNCGKICDEYAERDHRIQVIHQENGGLSAARNTGIDRAFDNSDSEWLTFVDSDDWIHCRYLELLYQSCKSNRATIAVCRYKREREFHLESLTCNLEGKAESIIASFERLIEISKEGLNPVIACCRLYKKELFIKNRFPHGKLHEDLFIIPQVQYESNRISIVDQALYYYFYTESSITRAQWSWRRLDEVEASENLIRFTQQKKLKKAESWAKRRYVWVLDTQIKSLERVSEYDKNAYRLLCHKRRRALIKYKKEYPLKDNVVNRCEYEQAFPKLAWLYWECVGISHKIKMIGKKDANN